MTEPFRVLVCGGRDFADREWMEIAMNTVSAKHAFLHVIAGGAAGADTLAVEWAEKNGCDVTEHYAAWGKYGPAAGPIRNQKMLDDERPQLVVAFPGGKGTADMVRRAEKAGVRVWRVPPKSEARVVRVIGNAGEVPADDATPPSPNPPHALRNSGIKMEGE